MKYNIWMTKSWQSALMLLFVTKIQFNVIKSLKYFKRNDLPGFQKYSKFEFKFYFSALLNLILQILSI